MNKKNTLILLEGIDEEEKSILYQLVREKINYGPLVIDGYLANNFAYDTFYKREHYIKNYKKAETNLMRAYDVKMVYLTCIKEALEIRMVKNNKEIKDLSIIDGYFHLYFVLSSFSKIIIDTSDIMMRKNTAIIISEFSKKNIKEDTSLISRKWYNEISENRKYEDVCKNIRIFNGEYNNEVVKGK